MPTAPQYRPGVTAACLVGKQSVSPSPSNACLVSIILTVSSSAGPRCVFHYPPEPSSVPRVPASSQAQRDEECDSVVDEDDAEGDGSDRDSDTDAGDDDDDDADESEEEYEGAGAVVGMADILNNNNSRRERQRPENVPQGSRRQWRANVIKKATRKLLGGHQGRPNARRQKNRPGQAGSGLDETDIRQYIPWGLSSRADFSGNITDNNLASWEKILGYPVTELAKVLTPSRVFHKKRFEVGIGELMFIGAPRFAHQEGHWRSKRQKRDMEKAMGLGLQSDREGSGANSPNEPHGSHTPKESDGGSESGSQPKPDPARRASGASRSVVIPEMNMFNIVFVLNPPTLEYQIRVEEMYDHVALKLSKVLKYEQAADNFVWDQAKEIWDIQDKAKEQGYSANDLWSILLENSPLARAIATVYEAISTARIAHINMTGRLNAYLQIPQPVSTSYMPTTMRPQIPGLWLTTTSMTHYGLGDPSGDNEAVVLNLDTKLLGRKATEEANAEEFDDGFEADTEQVSGRESEGRRIKGKETSASSPSTGSDGTPLGTDATNSQFPSPETIGSNDNINAYSFDPPDWPEKPPPLLSPHAALLLLDEPAVLLRQIRETDPEALSNNALTTFILLVSPTKSLLQLATSSNTTRIARALERLRQSDDYDETSLLFSPATIAAASEISLREMQVFSQHLIYWRRARAIPPLHPRDTYVVSANAPIRSVERDSIRFALQFCSSVKKSSLALSATTEMVVPSLPELLEHLSGGERPKPYRDIIGPDSDRETRRIYMDVLAWLMRYGYVTQLHCFAWVQVPPAVKKMVRDAGQIFLPEFPDASEDESGADDNGSALSARFHCLYDAVQRRMAWSASSTHSHADIDEKQQMNLHDPSHCTSGNHHHLVEDEEDPDEVDETTVVMAPLAASPREIAWLAKVGDLIGCGGFVSSEDEIAAYCEPPEGRFEQNLQKDATEEATRRAGGRRRKSTAVPSPTVAERPGTSGGIPGERAGRACTVSPARGFYRSSSLPPSSARPQSVRESDDDDYDDDGSVVVEPDSLVDSVLLPEPPVRSAAAPALRVDVGTVAAAEPRSTSPSDHGTGDPPSSATELASAAGSSAPLTPGGGGGNLSPSDTDTDTDSGLELAGAGAGQAGEYRRRRRRGSGVGNGAGERPRSGLSSRSGLSASSSRSSLSSASTLSTLDSDGDGGGRHRLGPEGPGADGAPDGAGERAQEDAGEEPEEMSDGEFHEMLVYATREFWPRLLPYLDGAHPLDEVPLREGISADLMADMVKLLDREGWLTVYRGW